MSRYVVLATVRNPEIDVEKALLYSLDEQNIIWKTASNLEQDNLYTKIGSDDAEEYQKTMGWDKEKTIRLIVEERPESLSKYPIMTVCNKESLDVGRDLAITVNGMKVGIMANTAFLACPGTSDASECKQSIHEQLTKSAIHLLLDEKRQLVLRILPDLPGKCGKMVPATPGYLRDSGRSPDAIIPPQVKDKPPLPPSNGGTTSKKEPPGLRQSTKGNKARGTANTAGNRPSRTAAAELRAPRATSNVTGGPQQNLEDHILKLVERAVTPILEQKASLHQRSLDDARVQLQQLDMSIKQVAKDIGEFRHYEKQMDSLELRIRQLESELDASMELSRNQLREDLKDAIVVLMGYKIDDHLAENAASVMEELLSDSASVSEGEIQKCTADVKRMEDDLLHIRRLFIETQLLKPE